jgi:hypothetical protein
VFADQPIRGDAQAANISAGIAGCGELAKTGTISTIPMYFMRNYAMHSEGF